MWIFGSNFAVSIVAPQPGTKHYRDGKLCVRARVPGDITRAFGRGWQIEEGQGSDYRFRAFIPRSRVAEAMATSVSSVTYTNFKDSVDPKDKTRKGMLMRVWNAMVAWQVEVGGRAWEYAGSAHRLGTKKTIGLRSSDARYQRSLDRGFPAGAVVVSTDPIHSMSDEDWEKFCEGR